MPDLISHAVFGHALRRGYGLVSGKTQSRSLLPLFYLGIILPDVLTRPVYILLPASHRWTVPLHTPFGMLLVCLFLALLFYRSVRRPVFTALFTGSCVHFLLDLLQKKILPNDYWLFPVTWKTIPVGLLWSDDFIVLIPFAVAAVGLGEHIRALHNKKRREDPSRRSA